MSLVDTLPVLAKTLAVAKTAVAPLERIKILLLEQTTSEETGRVLLGLSLPLGSGPVVDLVAGSAAGGTAVLCTYPLDLARTKLAYQVSDTGQSFRGGTNGFYRQPPYSGITMAYKEGGPRGLYRGIGPTLTGILPYAGLKFYIYEELKRHVEEHQNSVRMHLPCGALAGLFGQTLTYPLDDVENLLPMTGDGSNKRYKNTFDGLNTIVRTQGWRQLFAGLSINYIKDSLCMSQ
ncbi:hypothetical protein Bca4012_070556 [Brassica carinata]